MRIYNVTIKDGPDLYILAVFADSVEEAKEAAGHRIHSGRVIKAVRAK